MIKANFKAYSTYVTDSLHQWDINQDLEVTGLNITTAPEVHFSNSNMKGAIVRQATLKSGVVSVKIPNSLLQEPFRIFAHIGIYEGDTFKVIELVEIPVNPRKRPEDYQITDTDEELYSFKRLENQLANKATTAQVANIIAHNNDTNGNTELVDVRTGADNKVYASAGEAVRAQVEAIKNNLAPYAAFVIPENLNVTDFAYASQSPGASDYILHLPKLVISFREKSVSVEATDISCNPVGGYLHYVYYNFDTSEYATIYWRNFYTMPSRASCALVGIFRADMMHLHLFEQRQRDDYSLPFVSVIAGRYTNGAAGGLPVIDTVARKITFPDDTLLRVTNAWHPYFTLKEADGNTTCDFSGFASSAVHIVFDTVTQKMYPMQYNTYRVTINNTNVQVFAPRFFLVCSIRTWTGTCSCLFPYICDGKFMGQDMTDYIDLSRANVRDGHPVRAVAHRGYSADAPENTLPSYRMAKRKGFNYAECDVSFTKDGVAVLLHDSTVDRTSNGSGNIAGLTYGEAKAMDFGSWKGEEYTGTTIPTFEEFVALCRAIGLRPYIEVKEGTEAQIKGLVDTVIRYGLREEATWISFSKSSLSYIKAADDKARLGYVVDAIDESVIATAQSLQTDKNDVFIDCAAGNAAAGVGLCTAARIPLEVWTVNDEGVLQGLPDYVSGVTSDKLIAGDILYQNNI